MPHTPTPLAAPTRLCILTIAALLACGCNGGLFDWKGGATPGNGGGDSQDRTPWQIKPVNLSVHPSTRFVSDAHQTALEARVEFVDDAGDPIKAAGDLRFDLFPAGHIGETPSGKPIYSWQASILTRADNQRQYDAVTGGYLFRLKLNDAATARLPVRLRVTFLPPDGARLEVEQTIAPPAPTLGAAAAPATDPSAP